MIITARTHVGKIRTNNEDSIGISDKNQAVPFIMIADGMGGHNAGEVASANAVEIISKELEATAANEMETAPGSAIHRAIMKANLKVSALGHANKGMNGMGTTITLAVLMEERICIGHIGDSRAYLFHMGTLSCLTKDHSVVQELLDMGKITAEEARKHPQKNVITRALGVDYDVMEDYIEVPWEKSDVLFLCSDGLTNLVTDEEIQSEFRKRSLAPDWPAAHSLEECMDALVELALRHGGNDNISVVAALNGIEVMQDHE